jgi:hypothetical protein
VASSARQPEVGPSEPPSAKPAETVAPGRPRNSIGGGSSASRSAAMLVGLF